MLKKLDWRMQEVIRGASIALIIKLLAAGLGFFSNVIIARLLGAEGAGIYFLALTVITIGSVLGRVGLDNTLLRFTAANASVFDWQAVKGVFRKGILFAWCTSSAVTLIIFLLAPVLGEWAFSEPKLTILLRWMTLAIVPVSLFNLYAQLLRGIGIIRDAMLVLSVWLPTFFIMGLVVLGPTYDVLGAVWAYSGSAIITCIIGMFLWHKATPQLRGLTGRFKTRQLLDSSVPLFWVSGSQLLIQWSANCVLAIWRTSPEVAIFSLANRTALLTSLILVAVNAILAPNFAALYKQGDIQGLGRLAKSSAKLMTFLVAPIILPLLIAPDWIMSLFGVQFTSGGKALAVISAGQFVNVATGAVGPILMMCGYERLLRNNFICCAIICLILNLTLIPAWGVLGAALAMAATLVLQNLVSVALVWRRLGIMTIPGISLKAIDP